MQNRLLYILLAVVAVILIVRASVFTVSEGQLAIKSIGGEIVESNYKPGLHFRIPLVNGAQPTERVERLLKTSGAWEEFSAAKAK